ncbi:MAG: LLM class flavin-dependent oxidoreductase, partial [Candidatus Rokuibacteriota bacterium]
MRNGLKWGVFSLSQYPDQTSRVEGLEADLKLFELAEALGYDTAWVAEHLFSTYGIVTSTQVLCAAAAQRLRR